MESGKKLSLVTYLLSVLTYAYLECIYFQDLIYSKIWKKLNLMKRMMRRELSFVFYPLDPSYPLQTANKINVTDSETWTKKG